MSEDQAPKTKAELAEALRVAKEEAWDEGWQACINFSTYPEIDGEAPISENPYRKGAGDE